MPDFELSYEDIAGPAVYKLYGKGDKLSYVGSTGSILGRLQTHFNNVYWRRAGWSIFDSWLEAQAEEERLILENHPLGNRAGVSKPYAWLRNDDVPDKWRN